MLKNLATPTSLVFFCLVMFNVYPQKPGVFLRHLQLKQAPVGDCGELLGKGGEACGGDSAGSWASTFWALKVIFSFGLSKKTHAIWGIGFTFPRFLKQIQMNTFCFCAFGGP